MTKPEFHPVYSLSMLPEVIPVFPLTGIVLLPRARLPLNIFEPRYLAMIDAAFAQGRLVGMVQPTDDDDEAPVPPLYQVGCVGRIVSFSEADDGRYLVSLQGVCRFRIKDEVPPIDDYRRVKADWAPYVKDLSVPESGTYNRAQLLSVLRTYFKTFKIEADWAAVQNMADDLLVSSLSMICPLEPNEKQALLEASDIKQRAEMLVTLLKMAAMPQGEIDKARH